MKRKIGTKKVLIVEDISYEADETEIVLGKYDSNIECKSVPNLEDALLELKKFRPLVVIIDMGIDQKGDSVTHVDRYLGLSLIEKIRAVNKSVHLIAYTIISQDKLEPNLRNNNVHYVSKEGYGLTPLKIVTKVAELLKNIKS